MAVNHGHRHTRTKGKGGQNIFGGIMILHDFTKKPKVTYIEQNT